MATPQGSLRTKPLFGLLLAAEAVSIEDDLGHQIEQAEQEPGIQRQL
jgi:hypothetical protein